ncbi:unnamed protein product, partial [Prorocentrum cordatum]
GGKSGGRDRRDEDRDGKGGKDGKGRGGKDGKDDKGKDGKGKDGKDKDDKGRGKGKKGKEEKVVTKGLRGKVVQFLAKKEGQARPSGFISRADGEKDVYFDAADILDGETVEQFDPVEFDVVEGTDGRMYAARVKKLPKGTVIDERSAKAAEPITASKAGSLTGSLTGKMTLGPKTGPGAGRLTGGLSLRPGGLTGGISLTPGGAGAKKKEEEKKVEFGAGGPTEECAGDDDGVAWGRIVSGDVFFRAADVVGMNCLDQPPPGLRCHAGGAARPTSSPGGGLLLTIGLIGGTPLVDAWSLPKVVLEAEHRSSAQKARERALGEGRTEESGGEAGPEAGVPGGEDGPSRVSDLFADRYGLAIPRLLDFEVARLHGFDSPTAGVVIAQWFKAPSGHKLSFTSRHLVPLRVGTLRAAAPMRLDGALAGPLILAVCAVLRASALQSRIVYDLEAEGEGASDDLQGQSEGRSYSLEGGDQGASDDLAAEGVGDVPADTRSEREWQRSAAQPEETAPQAEPDVYDGPPRKPGCYMRMLSRCPRSPLRSEAWRHDSWAEEHGLDEAGCKRRKRTWDRRNSNGYKTIWLAADDEVSFTVSKDSSGKACAVEIYKERKGAWRTGRPSKGQRGQQTRKETIKDQMNWLMEMDTEEVLKNASLFKDVLEAPDFNPSHLLKIVSLLASPELMEDTRSDQLYRIFLASTAMQASLRTTVIKHSAGKHSGSFLEECLRLLVEIVMRGDPKALRGQLPLQELAEAWETAIREGSTSTKKGLPEEVMNNLVCLEKNFPDEINLDRIKGTRAKKTHTTASDEAVELMEADYYQDMPILPTSNEMLGQCAFEIQENMRTYDKCEDFIQTHFMLLRE